MSYMHHNVGIKPSCGASATLDRPNEIGAGQVILCFTTDRCPDRSQGSLLKVCFGNVPSAMIKRFHPQWVIQMRLKLSVFQFKVCNHAVQFADQFIRLFITPAKMLPSSGGGGDCKEVVLLRNIATVFEGVYGGLSLQKQSL